MIDVANETIWHGCYDDTWKGVITDAAFAHPAKFANGLVRRIYDYLFERGYLAKGSMPLLQSKSKNVATCPRCGGCVQEIEVKTPASIVVDPFAGIGCGGIIGASRGIRWFGCELEQRFFEMAQANFAIHARTWAAFGDPLPVMVNGDSRNLRANLAGVLAACVVGSPPYASGTVHDGGIDPRAFAEPHRAGGNCQATTMKDYGHTPGQLGAMKSGTLEFCRDCGACMEIVSCPLESALIAEPNVPPATNRSGAENAPTFRATATQNTDAIGRTPSVTNPSTVNRGQKTTDGAAETSIGEDSIGSSRIEPPANAMATNASSAEVPGSSTSITSKRGKRRAANGTTDSKTSKRSAVPATPRKPESGESNSAKLCVECASKNLSQVPGTRLFVPSNADAHGGEKGTGRSSFGSLPSGSVADVLVSSPPFTDGGAGDSRPHGGMKTKPQGTGLAGGGGLQHYGDTTGQLSTLPAGSVAGVIDGLVSSPPWENQEPSHAQNDTPSKQRLLNGTCNMGKRLDAEYGDTAGNIGNSTGETFWAASKLIVSECFEILKPGGVAVWVVKNFVRKGQIVPFSDDWRRLCEASGFVMVEWIKASLVKERPSPDMFGGPQTRTTERKSFFRRLAESKGSPRIDFEDVLVMRKPDAEPFDSKPPGYRTGDMFAGIGDA